MTKQEYLDNYFNVFDFTCFDVSGFVTTFTKDFYSLLDEDPPKSSNDLYYSVKAMKELYRELNQNNSFISLPDSLWESFYESSVIEGALKHLFPNKYRKTINDREIAKLEQERRKREQKERREREKKKAEQQAWERAQESRKRQSRRNSRYSEYNKSYEKFESFNFRFKSQSKSSFELLNLPVSSTKEEVKKAYRKLSLLHHPDKGGDSKKFIEITEARDKCMKILGV